MVADFATISLTESELRTPIMNPRTYADNLPYLDSPCSPPFHLDVVLLRSVIGLHRGVVPILGKDELLSYVEVYIVCLTVLY